MTPNANSYDGYAILASANQPIGVVSHTDERAAYSDLKQLPANCARFLVAIEDRRFHHHGAIDAKAILRAAWQNTKARRIVQGGSTITQQLARNILRDNSRNIARKMREVLVAFQLEKRYSKDEIIGLYFNRVYWGKKIYGLRAASLEYFSREPQNLSVAQQLALLTLLRGPNYYIKNPDGFRERYEMLADRLSGLGIITPREALRLQRAKLQMDHNNLQVFRSESVPFITRNVSHKKRVISSTVEKEIHEEINRFIDGCKYPTSAVCISNGSLIALAGSYGASHALSLRTNVGSALKPFIYTYLRQCGIAPTARFSTENVHGLQWVVGEAQRSNERSLTLKEALLKSNNNVFVNASFDVGIEKVLGFLARLTGRSESALVPASILGATSEGITLFELTNIYYHFFLRNEPTGFRKECLAILHEVATSRFGMIANDVFLKTGTTNKNRERFAIAGNSKLVFGFLREEHPLELPIKDGGLLGQVRRFVRRLSQMNLDWRWI